MKGVFGRHSTAEGVTEHILEAARVLGNHDDRLTRRKVLTHPLDYSIETHLPTMARDNVKTRQVVGLGIFNSMSRRQ